MNCPVHSPIGACCIAEQIRDDHIVVEGRIKNMLLFLASPHLDLTEFAVPKRTGLGFYFIELLLAHLLFQILQSGFRAGG